METKSFLWGIFAFFLLMIVLLLGVFLIHCYWMGESYVGGKHHPRDYKHSEHESCENEYDEHKNCQKYSKNSDDLIVVKTTSQIENPTFDFIKIRGTNQFLISNNFFIETHTIYFLNGEYKRSRS